MAIEKLVQQQVIKNNEKTCLGKDGREIPVLFSASAMLDKDENVQGIVCVASDITDRKQAEEALKVSEANYRQLFQAEPDAILISNSQVYNFLRGLELSSEQDIRGKESCYFQKASISLDPEAEKDWIMAIETNQDHGDIEHYRPKSKFPELTFTWSNLLLEKTMDFFVRAIDLS